MKISQSTVIVFSHYFILFFVVVFCFVCFLFVCFGGGGVKHNTQYHDCYGIVQQPIRGHRLLTTMSTQRDSTVKTPIVRDFMNWSCWVWPALDCTQAATLYLKNRRS